MKHLLLKADEDTRREFVSYLAKSFLGVGLVNVAGCGNTEQAGTPPLTQGEQDEVVISADGDTTPRRAPTAKAVIYLYMSGGMSHLDSWDPKPGRDVMGPSSAISTNADGIQVGNNFSRMAKHMDKVAVINSMHTTQGAHAQGNYFMHTSYTKRASITHPGLGSWISRLSGPGNPEIPNNVFIGGERGTGGVGFFESLHGPVAIGDPTHGLKNTTRRNGVTETELSKRLVLAEQLDLEFHSEFDQKQVRAYNTMYEKAVELMQSEDLVAFDVTKEPKAAHEKFGKSKFGQGCLLARRLVENGVRFVEVNLGGWDHHNQIEENFAENSSQLDQGMAALLDDLEQRGLLDETIVVLATEFGRTPNINQNAGRDHYPKAFSCLLAGGGIVGGQKYGMTDEDGKNVIAKKVEVPDLNATIAYGLGLPYNEVVYSPSKRPFTVTDTGNPLISLFG